MPIATVNATLTTFDAASVVCISFSLRQSRQTPSTRTAAKPTEWPVRKSHDILQKKCATRSHFGLRRSANDGNRPICQGIKKWAGSIVFCGNGTPLAVRLVTYLRGSHLPNRTAVPLRRVAPEEPSTLTLRCTCEPTRLRGGADGGPIVARANLYFSGYQRPGSLCRVIYPPPN